MGKNNRSGKGGRHKARGGPSFAKCKNPSVSETISLLERSQISPYKKAAQEERRRVQKALCSAQYIPNCLESVSKKPRGQRPSTTPRIVLYQGGSLEAAEWASEQLLLSAGSSSSSLPWCKPAVLDFASDSNPGGGWRGHQQGTQEEAICRVSSLGLSLERLQPFSIPHSGCVYVPDVAVVRQPKSQEWRTSPFWCSVVAAALRRAEHSDWILNKIRGVLAVATANGHGSFVGGAWGCGAFGNEAELVAAAWLAAAKTVSSDDMALLVLALPSMEMMTRFRSALPDATLVLEAPKG